MDPGLRDILTDHLFGQPLVVNHIRGTLAEAMIARSISPCWRWSCDGWDDCDFRHEDGTRLEVKQSAALQSWSTAHSRPGSGSFDIARRRLHWSDAEGWREAGARAEIYVFAWHGETDIRRADHRDAGQWIFYVMPGRCLPAQKRLSLSVLRRMTEPLGIDGLDAALLPCLSRPCSPACRHDEAPPAAAFSV